MTAAAAIMAGMLVLSGCADTVSAASGTSAKAADTAETSTADTSSQDATTAGTDTTAAASADGTAAGTAATQTASTGNESLETLAAESSLYLTGDYSDKDKDTGEGSDAQKLTISGSGQTYTISEAGTYVITGTATDSRIIVDAGDDGNVHLILAGMSISNGTTAPIYVKTAKNCRITLQDGTENTVTDSRSEETDTASSGTDTETNTDTNTASDTEADTDDSQEDLSAAIYSRSDLIINGSGTLTVKAGYNDGIKSKDDLEIVSGTIAVDAADDGIVGKDSVSIADGTLTITSGGDGIKTTNDEDTSKGYFILDGGAVTIEAGDDGVDSTESAVINGGTLTVAKCEEGLEALFIAVHDGTVDITASDDGINISDGAGSGDAAGGMGGGNAPSGGSGDTQSDSSAPGNGAGMHRGGAPGGGNAADGGNAFSGGGRMSGMAGGQTIDGLLLIDGGRVTVDASGDGLDSNGSIYINGGYTIVSGSTQNDNSALDYNGSCRVDAGVLLLSGTAGMAQYPDTDSKLSTAYASVNVDAGTEVSAVDADGNELYSWTVDKDADLLQLAAPEITSSDTVSFVIGGTKTAAEIK